MNVPCDKYLADPGTPGECRNCGFPKRTHSPLPASVGYVGVGPSGGVPVSIGHASTTDWRTEFEKVEHEAGGFHLTPYGYKILQEFIEKTIASERAEVTSELQVRDEKTFNKGAEYGRTAALQEVEKLITEEIAAEHMGTAGKTSRLTSLYNKVASLQDKKGV